MARPRKNQPEYKFHASGQARVWIDGDWRYLGEYNSPESRAKYYALLHEYAANGNRLPAQAATHLDDAPITVACVTGEFREEIKARYAGSENTARNYRNLCTLLEDEYAAIPAEEFGPRKLRELRDLFVASGNCRKYVNQQSNNIVRIFKHAVSRELIRPEVIVALQSLDPLRAGQTAAKESVERQPVDMEHVRATAKFLPPVVKAMVVVQVATGMRPGEVTAMRPCDIDTSGDEWFYRPVKHKTAHHGKKRAVPIIDEARKVLTPYLQRDREAACFSPAESYAWNQEQRAAARVTPNSCGNRPGSNRVKEPRWKPGKQFHRDSYRNAVKRAAKKAGVPHWFPYQLRHTAATVVREALGIEATQALVGHSTRQMAEHYGKVTEATSIEAAKAAPRVD